MAETLVKSWSLPAEHPVFRGHFPGNPIVPGVMLLEWVMAEVAQRLARPPAALRVREAKFFTPLAPSQLAELRCELDQRRCNFNIQSRETPVVRGILEWDGDD